MPPFPDGIAECQSCGVQDHRNEKGASVEKATIIGVDLAKNVFQVHGAAADGTVLYRKKLTRLQFHRFMAEQPACLVAMGACGGAHYWAREMRRIGHDIRLIASNNINNLRPEMGWMPLSPDGIAMCETCGVEAQAEGEGIHGRS